ncbi:MAG: manganese efflux pump MntP family protein [Oscillospiraceae bacterium]|nr:manganese efflux pump MntP family protein [Oscillospiraceae bacterium]
MSVFELFFVAVGLSADAFAVAVADGLSLRRRRKAFLIAFLFGLFQALMPLGGYLLGSGLAEYITEFDHFLALGVLGVIGGKMITESIRELTGDAEAAEVRQLGFPELLLQAVATSIDAFMVGVSFAAIGTRIVPAALLIGAVTFGLSLAGAVGGKRLGERLGSKAELAGGIVLMIIGIKTFLEHVF